jgi:hypothetical protein
MATIEINPTKIKSLPKFRNARVKFNWPPHHFLGFLCAFWGTVGENNETGEISDWTPDYLAEVVGIGNVDPKALWEVLVECGYIETRDDGRVLVTDWIQIAGDPLERKYHSSNPQHLDNIWALHGQIRRRATRKGPENPSGDLKDALRKPKGDLEAPAPPDIIKEPPKDRERDGEKEEEGNAFSFPSWETEGKEKAATRPASRSRTRVELDEAPEVERRDEKTRPEVHLLLDRFHDRLTEHYGEAPSFAYGPWGKFLKMLLKDGHPFQEIDRRFQFWLASTDPFVRQNRNSAGAFHNRFNELKAGPISNHGSRSNGRQPFDDGAATVRAESESSF